MKTFDWCWLMWLMLSWKNQTLHKFHLLLLRWEWKIFVYPIEMKVSETGIQKPFEPLKIDMYVFPHSTYWRRDTISNVLCDKTKRSDRIVISYPSHSQGLDGENRKAMRCMKLMIISYTLPNFLWYNKPFDRINRNATFLVTLDRTPRSLCSQSVVKISSCRQSILTLRRLDRLRRRDFSCDEVWSALTLDSESFFSIQRWHEMIHKTYEI